MEDPTPPNPPVLDYAAEKPRRRWIAKFIAFLMFAAGILEVIFSVLAPSIAHTTADQMVEDHNRWVRLLPGLVLMIPAACLVLGRFRDSGDCDA